MFLVYTNRESAIALNRLNPRLHITLSHTPHGVAKRVITHKTSMTAI